MVNWSGHFWPAGMPTDCQCQYQVYLVVCTCVCVFSQFNSFSIQTLFFMLASSSTCCKEESKVCVFWSVSLVLVFFYEIKFLYIIIIVICHVHCSSSLLCRTTILYISLCFFTHWLLFIMVSDDFQLPTSGMEKFQLTELVIVLCHIVLIVLVMCVCVCVCVCVTLCGSVCVCTSESDWIDLLMILLIVKKREKIM